MSKVESSVCPPNQHCFMTPSPSASYFCTKKKYLWCIWWTAFAHSEVCWFTKEEFINTGLSLHCTRGLPKLPNSTQKANATAELSSRFYKNSQVLFNSVSFRSLTGDKTCVLSITRVLARWEHILIAFQHIFNQEFESRNISFLPDRMPFAVRLYCNCILQNFALFWI